MANSPLASSTWRAKHPLYAAAGVLACRTDAREAEPKFLEQAVLLVIRHSCQVSPLLNESGDLGCAVFPGGIHDSRQVRRRGVHKANCELSKPTGRPSRLNSSSWTIPSNSASSFNASVTPRERADSVVLVSQGVRGFGCRIRFRSIHAALMGDRLAVRSRLDVPAGPRRLDSVRGTGPWSKIPARRSPGFVASTPWR